MSTTIERQQQAEAPARTPRVGRGIVGLAVLALAAVAVAGFVFLTQAPTPVEEPRAHPPIYTPDEQEVIRLVAAGVLPDEVLDAEPFRTKQLVAEGLIPRETLEAAAPRTPPLWCPEDLAVMQAVSAGVIPPEVLDGEPYRTKRLIAQGAIPWQAAEPCF